MNIIQPGTLPPEQEYRGTCSHCGCVVDFKQSEAMPDPHRQRETPHVACPTPGCGRTIAGRPLKPETIQS